MFPDQRQLEFRPGILIVADHSPYVASEATPLVLFTIRRVLRFEHGG